MEDLLKSLDKNTLIYILSGAITIILAVLGYLIKIFKNMFKVILKRFDLVEIKVGAMDYAIGKEFGNGYEGYRDSEESRLMKEYKFTKEGK